MDSEEESGLDKKPPAVVVVPDTDSVVVKNSGSPVPDKEKENKKKKEKKEEMSIIDQLPWVHRDEEDKKIIESLREDLKVSDLKRFNCSFCQLGGDHECLWKQLKEPVVDYVNYLRKKNKTNKEIRFALYRKIHKVTHSTAHERYPLYLCVERQIKRNFPNEKDDPYVGFKKKENDGK